MNYRHSASFGKRMEYYLIGLMLKEGLDCYIPMVDDDGIDVVIRKNDGNFIAVQIKARSNEVAFGDAALFAAIPHPIVRPNYFFVFYSERIDKMWILSSEEYRNQCVINKTGINQGKTSIKLNGVRKDKEYPLERFSQYLASDFSRFKT